MRRFLTGLVLTTIAIVLPGMAWADNQEMAEQIAKNMRASGQLRDYKVGVKYEAGTAWLTGRVRDEEQMGSALKVALSTPGVERVVNNLTAGTASSSTSPVKALAKPPAGQQTGQTAKDTATSAGSQPAPRNAGLADRVASSFSSTPAQPASAPESGIPTAQGAPRAIPRTGSAPGRQQRPIPVAYRMQEEEPPTNGMPGGNGAPGAPLPMYTAAANGGPAPVRYDQPCLPNYSWPSYAAYPNYASVTYPRQYSPTAWPYIGPFYPYPQVPLGWRRVTLEWDDGWWFLDFKDKPSCWESPLGRWY